MRAVKTPLAAGRGQVQRLCTAMLAGALCLAALAVSAADTAKKTTAAGQKNGLAGNPRRRFLNAAGSFINIAW